MQHGLLAVALAVVLGACGGEDPSAPTDSEGTEVVTPSGVERLSPTSPGIVPSADPRSAESAQARLAAYLQAHESETASADTLWGPGGPSAQADLSAEVFRQPGASLESFSVVSLGEPEGAAGSVYVQIPVAVTTRVGDEQQEERLVYTLRRVNDVPGAEPWTLRWHIEQVERVGPPPA